MTTGYSCGIKSRLLACCSSQAFLTANMKCLILLGLVFLAAKCVVADGMDVVPADMDVGVAQASASYERFMQDTYNGESKLE